MHSLSRRIAAATCVLLGVAGMARASDGPHQPSMGIEAPGTTSSLGLIEDTYPPPPATILERLTAPPAASAQASGTASPLQALMAERAPLVAASIPRLPANERAAFVAFYAERSHAPLWLDGESVGAAGKAIAERLANAAEDGLFAADYRLPSLEGDTDEKRVEIELRLSALAYLYARDARGGRVEPRRLSGLITPKLSLPTVSEVLEALAKSKDANAALAAYNPPHPGYRALRAKLADIRRGRTADEPMVRIPDGPPLRLGMRDARVPLIRARLNLSPSSDMTYDADLASAVSAFQKSAGLRVTGIAGDATIDALGSAMGNSPESRLDSDIVAQMERWRWLPVELGERHIFVNIPEFMVRIYDRGEIIHQARVIVGKPETPTPIFSHVMDHAVMNPSWFIPPSILRKDILPKLASDPDYAAKRGYVVTRRGNSISVRQPPGERNALGHVKFMFPNEHAVYLHDTPGRHLFNTSRRAYSHGCVRVDQPMKFGEIVLGRDEGWSEQRLRAMVGSGERTIRFSRPLQVHLTYMTHVVGADGEITIHDDIYGFHRRVKAALGLRG